MSLCPVPKGKLRDGERQPRIENHSSEDPARENLACSVPKHLQGGTSVGRARETPPEPSTRGLPRESPGSELEATSSSGQLPVEKPRRVTP
jgi:hypothetical protein